MARQVARHSRSAKTVYVDVSDIDGPWEFNQIFLSNVIHALQERFPSLHDERDCNQWPEREVRRIAGNGHAIVTVSEYCGLAAICLVPREHRDSFGRPMTNRTVLSEAWCYRMTEAFQKAIPYPTLVKGATASNGEAMYHRA